MIKFQFISESFFVCSKFKFANCCNLYSPAAVNMEEQAVISEEFESTESYFEILAVRCPLVCEYIFSYLEAKDLKECFLIHKQCNAVL